MYGTLFYKLRRRGARNAAGLVLPTVVEMLEPQSLVDVGCGTGSWLAEAAKLGVSRIRGLDGPWVKKSLLEISAEQFTAEDLSRPFALNESFDVAMSLEVAEHLPAESADHFVESLCRLAPVVVFSAAIPGQGGENHINEQWPAYWVGRFERLGFRLFDVLRPRLWNDRRIPYWYRQNLLLFVSGSAPRELLNRLEALEREATFGGADLVHPEHALRALQYPGVTDLLRAFPYAFARSLSAAGGLVGAVEARSLRLGIAVAALIAGSGFVYTHLVTASSHLDEVAIPAFEDAESRGGRLIILASEGTFERSALRDQAIGVHGEDYSVVMERLTDPHRNDYFVVSHRHVAQIEMLAVGRGLERVAANDHFIVYRETPSQSRL